MSAVRGLAANPNLPDDVVQAMLIHESPRVWAALAANPAVDPENPDQLAAGLADDEDLGVRVLLAQHHPAAPPALLLRSFLEYRGPGRRDLVRRPGFPVDGLARFAADPDPYARALAARDPSVEPDLVARLLDDPQEVVRRAMARCPRLPVNRLVDLLDDADLAEYAAANPSLPATEMLRILASG